MIKRMVLTGFLFFLIFSFLNSQNKGDDISIGKYDKIFSKILNEERTLMISLPWNYEFTTDKYPVLFMLDGETPSLSEAYYWLNSFGPMFPPMITIGIKNTDRNRDVLPSEKSDGSKIFLKFMTDELFPYIEKNYRTENFRILYGESNAGVFVIYSLFENKDAFSAYIASSPTICWRPEYMTKKIKEVSASDINLNKFLYVVYGDKEWAQVRDTLQKFIPMLEALKVKGLNLKTKYMPDESHVPPGSLSFGLKYIFEGYQYPDEKIEKEGLDSLKEYYVRFSKMLNYNVKIPIYSFLDMGQKLLRKKQIKDAINVFELFANTHPGNAYSEIFLAVSYYRDGNMDEAKKYYLKAKANKRFEMPPMPDWKEMAKRFE